ncbi:MAG: MarR family transcriptional regulator [Bacteroidota bacterium]
MMDIQEAIKQKKPFRSERQKAMVNLIFTYNHIMDCIRKELEPFEITVQQYNVLRILKGAGKPMSTSCIRERLVDRMSDTSRMVERLCKKGLLSKEVCCNDKRRVDIELSSEGLVLLNEMDNCSHKFEAILAELSLEEAAQLNQILDKIRG